MGAARRTIFQSPQVTLNLLLFTGVMVFSFGVVDLVKQARNAMLQILQ